MNCKDTFLQRREDFHLHIKDEMLAELNAGCKEFADWAYQDGYFYSHIKEKLLILKSDFECYVFETLAVLSEEGPPIEVWVASTDIVIKAALEIKNTEEVEYGEE